MSPGTTAVMSPGWRGEAVEATPGYPSEFREHWVREAARIRDRFNDAPAASTSQLAPARLFAQSESSTSGATSSAPPSWRVPAPVETHSADGQRSIAGPTEAGKSSIVSYRLM